jgi:hypothetical protein
MRTLRLLFAVALLIVPAWADPVFTLLPSGTIAGLPGDLIGWGFTITNDANYIEITSAQFCLDPVSFPACEPPQEGTFTDFISQFNDIVVGPPSGTLPDTVSQSFDPNSLTGVGSFSVSPSALLFSADIGQIVLTYNVFAADPNGPDGGNPLNSSDLVLAANATVSVDLPVSTPEPGNLLAVGGTFLALLAWRSPSRKRN